MLTNFKWGKTFMEKGKKLQKAGANSTQVQAQTIIYNAGITEDRAREIFSEQYTHAIQEYSQEATRIAQERIGQFEESLMSRIAQIEQALPAFGDPAFQFLIRRAQQTAASTERVSDYDLLSELLICHVQKGNDRKKRAGISRAVEIVDKIDNDALCALTVVHAVNSYVPLTGDLLDGLVTLNDLFESIMYQTLPSGSDWIEHLDSLGAIRFSPIGIIKKCLEHYYTALDGYVCTGILIDSEEYKQACTILKEERIDPNIITKNECLDNYVRLRIPSIKSLNNLYNENGQPITDNQLSALKRIIDLYSKDTQLLNEAQKKFEEHWEGFPSLHKVSQWWNAIPYAFSITSVGKVLAYTNAKRCYPQVPDII